MNPEELHEWWKKVKDIPIYGRYEPKEAKSFFTMPEYFDDAGILTWEAIPAAEAYGFGSIGVGTVHRDTVWPSLTDLLPQITEDFTGKSWTTCWKRATIKSPVVLESCSWQNER